MQDSIIKIRLMQEQISEALKKAAGAEYIEVRVEDSRTTRIQYRDREMEELGNFTSFGGNVRALVKGGWGFVCFNQPEGLREKAALATRQARLSGKEESQFAPVEPVEDIAEEPENDPSKIPLSKKKQLLDEYNELIWKTPKIQSSTISYTDKLKKVIFASSNGSYIEQIKPDLTLRIVVVAREGGEVQQAHLSLGSSGDFQSITNLHQQVQEVSRRAVQLLSAPQLKGGEYTVILDPVLAGVFAHEAFGHLSESDFIHENKNLREIMVPGRRFGEKHLNIVDDAKAPGLRGSYKYDDEGVPAHKNYLIREGVLRGRLHSRETAARMGESPTGNARAIDYHFPPIVRMTNTYIEPQGASFEDLLGELKEGVYVKNWFGGMTSMEMFTFSAGEAYRIRNGRIEQLLRPVVLSGNVFTTLANINAIAGDLEMNQGGGCGKGGQVPLPVSNGSPHIRIKKCLLGGR